MKPNWVGLQHSILSSSYVNTLIQGDTWVPGAGPIIGRPDDGSGGL
jgi:hypothetical protein